MKLATTTGDFFAYTDSQLDAMRHIREAGFKYADYSFHNIDCRYKRGVFAPDNRGHIESVNELADEIGLKFVQAHAPMGSPKAPLEIRKKTEELLYEIGKHILSSYGVFEE